MNVEGSGFLGRGGIKNMRREGRLEVGSEKRRDVAVSGEGAKERGREGKVSLSQLELHGP
jgi:hypothetical protein